MPVVQHFVGLSPLESLQVFALVASISIATTEAGDSDMCDQVCGALMLKLSNSKPSGMNMCSDLCGEGGSPVGGAGYKPYRPPKPYGAKSLSGRYARPNEPLLRYNNRPAPPPPMMMMSNPPMRMNPMPIKYPPPLNTYKFTEHPFPAGYNPNPDPRLSESFGNGWNPVIRERYNQDLARVMAGLDCDRRVGGISACVPKRPDWMPNKYQRIYNRENYPYIPPTPPYNPQSQYAPKFPYDSFKAPAGPAPLFNQVGNGMRNLFG